MEEHVHKRLSLETISHRQLQDEIERVESRYQKVKAELLEIRETLAFREAWSEDQGGKKEPARNTPEDVLERDTADIRRAEAKKEQELQIIEAHIEALLTTQKNALNGGPTGPMH